MEKNQKDIIEVKKKKEYSKLPSSLVLRALNLCNNDVKKTRSFLRKYFGVFLTNKVLKGKINSQDILKAHKSSQNRNYYSFYERIIKKTGKIESIIDLGSGVNGYSYNNMKDFFGEINYYGIEAVGQIVENMNKYFKDQKISKAIALNIDLFELDKIKELLFNLKNKKPRLVLMLQVIDALEGLENNYSKKLIIEVMKESEFIVLSLPTMTIGAKKKFRVNRKWIIDFLRQEFEVIDDFEESGERIIIIKAKR